MIRVLSSFTVANCDGAEYSGSCIEGTAALVWAALPRFVEGNNFADFSIFNTNARHGGSSKTRVYLLP